jgi:hypothetical protein
MGSSPPESGRGLVDDHRAVPFAPFLRFPLAASAIADLPAVAEACFFRLASASCALWTKTGHWAQGGTASARSGRLANWLRVVSPNHIPPSVAKKVHARDKGKFRNRVPWLDLSRMATLGGG